MGRNADDFLYRGARDKTNRSAEIVGFHHELAAAIEHIRPKSQQTIRYYGLYSNRSRGMAHPVQAPLIPPPQADPPMEKAPSNEPLLLPPPKVSAQAMRPLWRDLILSVWGADPLQCHCCKGTVKRVETIVRPEQVEFFLRLLGVVGRRGRHPTTAEATLRHRDLRVHRAALAGHQAMDSR